MFLVAKAIYLFSLILSNLPSISRSNHPNHGHFLKNNKKIFLKILKNYVEKCSNTYTESKKCLFCIKNYIFLKKYFFAKFEEFCRKTEY